LAQIVIHSMLATQDLKPGDRVKLVDYGPMNREYRRHLMSMGLVRGVEVEIMPATPVGCPWLVQIKGCFLSFWPKMLNMAVWERSQCAS
jgi:ferrous iron transport protein A